MEPPTAGLRGQSWSLPGHLLQGGEEEAGLRLNKMLGNALKSGCALFFGENLEPYGKREIMR